MIQKLILHKVSKTPTRIMALPLVFLMTGFLHAGHAKVVLPWMRYLKNLIFDGAFKNS